MLTGNDPYREGDLDQNLTSVSGFVENLNKEQKEFVDVCANNLVTIGKAAIQSGNLAMFMAQEGEKSRFATAVEALDNKCRTLSDNNTTEAVDALNSFAKMVEGERVNGIAQEAILLLNQGGMEAAMMKKVDPFMAVEKALKKATEAGEGDVVVKHL